MRNMVREVYLWKGMCKYLRGMGFEVIRIWNGFESGHGNESESWGGLGGSIEVGTPPLVERQWS